MHYADLGARRGPAPTSRTRCWARGCGSARELARGHRRAAAPTDVFGYPDDVKLRSSMTLFARAAPAEPVFAAVLDRYFDGEPDPATLERLP